MPEQTVPIISLLLDDGGATGGGAATWQIYYVHPDHLNTPRAITNQTQQISVALGQRGSVWEQRADAAGLTSPIPERFTWKRLPRPVWPLDLDPRWQVPAIDSL